MRIVLIASLMFAVAAGSAMAKEDKASKEEAAKVLAAIKEIGCEAAADEVEKENSGGFEVDDANCKIGQYDIKLTKDFNIQSITLD